MSEEKKYCLPTQGQFVITAANGEKFIITVMGIDEASDKTKASVEDGLAPPGRYQFVYDKVQFTCLIKPNGDCEMDSVSFIFDYNGKEHLVHPRVRNCALRHADQYIWSVNRAKLKTVVAFYNYSFEFYFEDDDIRVVKTLSGPSGNIQMQNVEFDWKG